MMNKMLQTIKQTLLLLSALTVISCSNITKTSDDNSNEASGIEKTEVQESKKNAYIRLSLSNPAERTVLPDITVDALTDFELTGTKSESTEQIQSEWTTRSDMQSAVLPVSTGHWSFTLTANKNGTTLSGTTEKNISLGENTLSFNLAVSDKGNGTGSFIITLDFSTATNSSNVNYAVATLENLDGNEVISVDSRSNTENISLVNKIITFNSSNTPVDAGTYRARIKLYAASGAEMASYRDLVQISTGCTSSDTQTIESLDKLYNVTYHQNDGALPAGTTLPETVTRKSIVNLPTLIRDYYDFGGWYTDENCTSGNEITSITNAQDNIDVYAKFTPISYSITYNLNFGSNPDGAIAEYTVEDTVTLPTPTDEGRTFQGWYSNSSYSGNAITGWTSNSTYHSSITLYAKWDIIKADATTIADEIQNMTESGTIKAIGAFTNENLRGIKVALMLLYDSNYNIAVSLDLTQTTGLLNSQEGDFSGCPNLREITIPSSVTEIGAYVFCDCDGLQSVTIPNSVTLIRDSAFCSCDSLTEITIPSSVTQIEWYAFGNCTKLKSVTIENGLTVIGDFAFSYCTSLTEITIPDSVIRIDTSAFQGCTGLTKITIPSGVTKINYHAFAECTNLTSVTFENPSNWYCTTSSNYTGGTAIDFSSNESQNATYLSSTYYDKYFYQKNQ